MKNKKLHVLASALWATQVTASPADNGFYIDADTSAVHFSADYFETTADINNDKKHLNENTKSYRNGDVGSQTIKFGYKHLNKNRVELFARKSTLNVGDSEEKITDNTVGLKYEWGLASLRSANKKVLPFMSIGAAQGKAKTKSNKLKLKTADIVELEANIGIHYKLSKHFDTTLGVHHRMNLLLDDVAANSEAVFTSGDIDSTSINIGVGYHF
jgi:hypothetical protein